FTARHGAASTLAATAYDALALIDAAAESAGGTPDRARLRDRLEATTFAGITTRYTFTAARHAGFDAVDLVFLRWSVGARVGFALAPEPAPKEGR
ncbi:MAG TPA: ABC transporter substrate-binding protein, partial [Candidatus Limnocylindria bacterium]